MFRVDSGLTHEPGFCRGVSRIAPTLRVCPAKMRKSCDGWIGGFFIEDEGDSRSETLRDSRSETLRERLVAEVIFAAGVETSAFDSVNMNFWENLVTICSNNQGIKVELDEINVLQTSAHRDLTPQPPSLRGKGEQDG